jgi:hypothetical protein
MMNIHRGYYYQGAHLRQRSLDTERRRQSLGTILPHRASDAFVDPYHAAILFRDARGLPVVDPFLEKVNISDLGESSVLINFFVSATEPCARLFWHAIMFVYAAIFFRQWPMSPIRVPRIDIILQVG